MQTTTKTLVTLAALMLQAPLQTVAAEKTRPDPAIEKTAGAYLKAVLAGDAAGVGATFRDDAVEMPPCRPLLKGRAAIEQYYRGLFEGPVKITEFTFSHLETVAAGDVGYTTGTYKQKLLPKSGQPIDDSGSFVVIVKREAGVWKAAYVIHNSDRPPAMPGSPAVALVSPFTPLMNDYAELGSEWVVRLGWLLLGCACVGVIAWLIRAVFPRDAARSRPKFAPLQRQNRIGTNRIPNEGETQPWQPAPCNPTNSPASAGGGG